MTPQEFAYWLQGFAELSGDAPPSKAQWKSIREHLSLVFEKVTPPVGIPSQWPPRQFVPHTPPSSIPLRVECSAAQPLPQVANR